MHNMTTSNPLTLPKINTKMFVKWRACIGDGQIGWAILTDLSKAFYCINQDLLIAKLPRMVWISQFHPKIFDKSKAKNKHQSCL